jgi:hypothetical protein
MADTHPAGTEVWGRFHVCGPDAAFYVTDRGRRAWVRRMGSLFAGEQAAAIRAFDMLFDDEASYVLFGRDPARLRLRLEIEDVERDLGAIEWDGAGPMPDVIGIIGDDGWPAQRLTFVRCEPPPSAVMRKRRKDFWE